MVDYFTRAVYWPTLSGNGPLKKPITGQSGIVLMRLNDHSWLVMNLGTANRTANKDLRRGRWTQFVVRLRESISVGVSIFFITLISKTLRFSFLVRSLSAPSPVGNRRTRRGNPAPPSLNKSRVAVRQNRVESYGNADCMRGGPLTDRNAEPLSRLYAAKFRSRRCTHWRLQVQLSHQLANAIKKQWPLCVPLILAHYS